MNKPDWLDEVIPSDEQEEYLRLADTYNGYQEVFVYSGVMVKHLLKWIPLWVDANEFSVNNRPRNLTDEHLAEIIWTDHKHDFIFSVSEIGFPVDLDWKMMTQLETYDKANKEMCEEEFGYLPKWRYSFDGKTWTYRPEAELFKAGEQYFTHEYWEKEYQRRLL